MLFRNNEHHDRGIWVDRGIDNRVDAFQVCAPCHEELMKSDPLAEQWHEMHELCPDCRNDFTAHAIAVELLGLPRPFNGMLEDRVLTNDDFNEEPMRPILGLYTHDLMNEGQSPSLSKHDPLYAFREDSLARRMDDYPLYDPNIYL